MANANYETSHDTGREESMTTLKEYLHQASRRFSHLIAMKDDEREFTYTETWQRGLRMANALLDKGFKPGDRVGTLEDNAIESTDLIIGCLLTNICRVPLYARNARDPHLHMLSSTKCNGIFVAEEYADLLEGLGDDVPAIKISVVRDGNYENWLASYSMDDPKIPVQPSDAFMIRHSGGTTGRAKGLLITHKIWLNALRNILAGYVTLLPRDIAYHFAPITHASGTLFFMAYLNGATNYMARSFEIDAMVEKLKAGQITNMFLPPTALRTLVQHPGLQEGFDPTPLKGLMIGGSLTPPDLAREAYRVFDGRMYQLYGASEAGPMTSIGPDEWFFDIEGSDTAAAAGRPLPWVEVEIRDPETGEVLPLGEAGEIVSRSEAQVDNFMNAEDEAKVFIDGWVRSGDIGRIDKNGWLYILDRKDDMIISGGFNIWPAELENVLQEHPEVIEATVFPVPHEHWGQTPYAVCVVSEGAKISEAELIKLCADRLGSYKKPSRVELTSEALPKTPVGKIDRKAMKARHAAAIASI